MPKTDLGSKLGNIAEPVDVALTRWIALMADTPSADEFIIRVLKVARFVVSHEVFRLFYYVSHDNEDGIWIGAEMSDEMAMELFLRFDWTNDIQPHSEIVFN